MMHHRIACSSHFTFARLFARTRTQRRAHSMGFLAQPAKTTTPGGGSRPENYTRATRMRVCACAHALARSDAFKLIIISRKLNAGTHEPDSEALILTGSNSRSLCWHAAHVHVHVRFADCYSLRPKSTGTRQANTLDGGNNRNYAEVC